jgi:3'-phosphoadenosine 5'-phosphosulfate (PAPS) 3'-phosphatase
LAVAVLLALAEIGLVADGVSNLPRIKTGYVAKTGSGLVKQHLYLVPQASNTPRHELQVSFQMASLPTRHQLIEREALSDKSFCNTTNLYAKFLRSSN